MISYSGLDCRSKNLAFILRLLKEPMLDIVLCQTTKAVKRNIILNRLLQLGTKVYRTDLNGNIVIKSDGTNINVSNQKNDVQAAVQTTTAKTTTAVSKPAPAISDTKVKTVYSTKTGTKYHTGSCSYLSSSKIPISLTDAVKKGLTPCSKCKP